MAALLTKDEIVSLSFTRKVDIVKISDRLIESVQFSHIKPILGKDLFDLVIATPASYETLINYLKPVIAYYVKYYVLPEIWIDISTTGVNKVNGNNRVVGQSDEFNQMRQTSLDNAHLHAKILTNYLDENYTLYPEYNSISNPENKIIMTGGFIFQQPNYSNDIDIDNYYQQT